MEFTITLKASTKKTKFLLGLIMEMAKSEKKYITVEPTKKVNNTTKKAINDSLNGVVTNAKNKKDFFTKLNS